MIMFWCKVLGIVSGFAAQQVSAAAYWRLPVLMTQNVHVYALKVIGAISYKNRKLMVSCVGKPIQTVSCAWSPLNLLDPCYWPRLFIQPDSVAWFPLPTWIIAWPHLRCPILYSTIFQLPDSRCRPKMFGRSRLLALLPTWTVCPTTFLPSHPCCDRGHLLD